MTKDIKAVVVCGGRDYENKEELYQKLDYFLSKLEFNTVIHGAAKGADRLAWAWANDRKIGVITYWAKWDKYGKSAGVIRNKEMLEMNPIAVIAFPGGSGTKNCIDQARAKGIRTYLYDDLL